MNYLERFNSNKTHMEVGTQAVYARVARFFLLPDTKFSAVACQNKERDTKFFVVFFSHTEQIEHQC